MLRLNRKYRERVSTRLAILAAFLLVTSSVAGIGTTMDLTHSDNQELADRTSLTTDQPSAPATANVQAKKKRFKASLFLLRL